MTKMRITAGAKDLGSNHAEGTILTQAQRSIGPRRPETWPAAAAVIFLRLVEKRRTAADAMEGSGHFRKIVVRKGSLGAVPARHVKGERR